MIPLVVKSNHIHLNNSQFSRIRIRFLLGWFIFGSVIFFSIPDAVTYVIPTFRIDGTAFEIISILFYSSVVLFCFELLERNNISVKRLFGVVPSFKKIVGPLALTFPVYIFSLFSLVFLAALAGILFPFDQNIFLTQDLESLEYVHPIASFIGTVIAAPIAEEIFFRGILFHRWAQKWGFQKAFITTSLLFGVLHVQNAISITIFAFILGIIYIRTGSLVLSILCHAMYNFFSFLQEQFSFASPNTPDAAAFDSLFSWDMVLISGIGAVFIGWFLISYIMSHWPRGYSALPYEKNINV